MSDAHEFGSAIDQGSEAKRFDPEGHYVRRWLPVLARLPAKYIHQPWLAPEAVLADAGGCSTCEGEGWSMRWRCGAAAEAAVRQLLHPAPSHETRSHPAAPPCCAGVELGANYPFPVISQEESAAALAAANAVVAQCQRGDGGSSGAQGVAPSTGPFRPATAADPAEAERLFAENYR